MILRVTQFGEPILRTKGEEVTEFDDKLKKLSADMIETMYDEDGIGLAAQQVDLALKLFVIDLRLPEDSINFDYSIDGKKPPLDVLMPLTIINAKIEAYGEEVPYNEGCLSFPDIRFDVLRHEKVRMEYQDLDGHSHHIECGGIFARCLLHEHDHTEGVLYIDRISAKERRSLDSKLKRLKRQSRDFLAQHKHK